MRRTSTRTNYQGQQDEETLRQFNIPLTLEDITQSSTEEYNRHLARLSYLNAEQIHIIKDIRRRGKNKVFCVVCFFFILIEKYSLDCCTKLSKTKSNKC